MKILLRYLNGRLHTHQLSARAMKTMAIARGLVDAKDVRLGCEVGLCDALAL